jgi:hypothetical protein
LDIYTTPGHFLKIPSAVDVNSWHPGGLISDGSMNRKQSPLHGTVPSDSHGNSRNGRLPGTRWDKVGMLKKKKNNLSEAIY